ncbi:electron transport complex subunit RsxC, partial [Cronobacter sakazakii]
RKAAQAGENATADEKTAEPVDPRKAAVEAAIARAKARKAAQAGERAQAANEENEADDPRKAAVAAAIARVQARKAAEKVVNED